MDIFQRPSPILTTTASGNPIAWRPVNEKNRQRDSCREFSFAVGLA